MTKPRRSSARRAACARAGAGWCVAAIVVSAWSLSGCGSDASQPTGSVGRGREIVDANRCSSCHSPTGSAGVGPTWKGIYGTEVELEDGRKVVVDDDYLRRAINDPQADRVAGFTTQMPAFKLSPDDVDAVIAYIRTLSENGS